MSFYADLHIHSKYSRATSRDCDLENLAYWGRKKGITVIGTGDFTHPAWIKEIKEKLVAAEPGLFKLKPAIEKAVSSRLPAVCHGETRFMLSVEVSTIYKKGDKVRKIHHLIYAPTIEKAEKINRSLEKIGNIRSDGRPILGLDSRDLLEIVLETDPMSYLIPAHIWTPWFAVLGSKGGFDRIEDCFADLTKHVFAVETGLSSDPAMNWRLKQLDPFVLVSNSDAHSPAKLGREATIYDTEFSYRGIYKALSDPKDKGLQGTIEFFPEEGKYHYDGHRACQIRWHPKETIKNKGVCPKCGKPVTIGVMSRVEELADRPEGEKSPRSRPYKNLIPLPEVIAEAKGVGVNSQEVQRIFRLLLSKIGNEMFILQDALLKDIEMAAGDLAAAGIARMREGQVEIAAGYDGEYGTIHFFSEEDRKSKEGQLTLFA